MTEDRSGLPENRPLRANVGGQEAKNHGRKEAGCDFGFQEIEVLDPDT